MTFDEITNAARKNDREKLESILPHSSVDVRKQGAFNITPAAELAIEGRFIIVEHLRNNYGANVNCIAYGLAFGGHFDALELYRTQHGARVNDIVYGLAFGGHFDALELYRTQHGASVNDIAFGLAAGEHIENTQQQLHFLFFAPNNDFRQIENIPNVIFSRSRRMQELRSSGYDFDQALLRTSSRKRILTSVTLTSASKLEAGIIFWLAHINIIAKEKNLPIDILMKITQFYSPIVMTEAKLKTTHQLFYKSNVKFALNAYCRQSSFFHFKYHEKRASSLMRAVDETPFKDVPALIKEQQQILTGALDGEANSTKHHERAPKNTNKEKPYNKLIASLSRRA